MRKIFKLVVYIFVACVLSGCSMFHGSGNGGSKKAEAVKNVSVLSRKLAGYNVCVFQNNNSLKLVLPSKYFFRKNSANFTGDAYEVLDLIFSLSSYYKESTIAVTGYSKSSGDDEFAMALAKERACKIVQHLWKYKIDSNFMYANALSRTFANKKTFLSDCTLIEFLH